MSYQFIGSIVAIIICIILLIIFVIIKYDNPEIWGTILGGCIIIFSAIAVYYTPDVLKRVVHNIPDAPESRYELSIDSTVRPIMERDYETAKLQYVSNPRYLQKYKDIMDECLLNVEKETDPNRTWDLYKKYDERLKSLTPFDSLADIKEPPV